MGRIDLGFRLVLRERFRGFEIPVGRSEEKKEIDRAAEAKLPWHMGARGVKQPCPPASRPTQECEGREGVREAANFKLKNLR